MKLLNNPALFQIDCKIETNLTHCVLKMMRPQFSQLDIYGKLQQILANSTSNQVIVFVNQAKHVQDLEKHFQAQNFQASGLYSSLKKAKKHEVKDLFVAGKIKYLVATENMVEKFDFSKLSLIVNLDLPEYLESYQARLGNLGALGQHGTVLNFVTQKSQEALVEELEFHFKSKFGDCPSELVN